MRARRQFQPSLDLMPMRLAPSDVGTIISPMDPLARPDTSPTAIINPMDPLARPDSGPSMSNPRPIGPGSYTPLITTTTTHMTC
jgi:hypothetical protein